MKHSQFYHKFTDILCFDTSRQQTETPRKTQKGSNFCHFLTKNAKIIKNHNPLIKNLMIFNEKPLKCGQDTKSPWKLVIFRNLSKTTKTPKMTKSPVWINRVCFWVCYPPKMTSKSKNDIYRRSGHAEND
jgi:hypothetical protein